ncbi:unnamed protein product [Schistosoma margrebowiei]|uniref:Uncharacterized protein n=1 Tax=Schistosoma margrebowiei TaxID=48269 RepID=A0A183MI84_9TREM|nr:unnamed protein product [Schistosoma margrebowiei]
MKLDGLEFADNLALLSQTQQQIQENKTSVVEASTAMKTGMLAAASELVSLNINKGKSKILKFDTENTNPMTTDEKTLEIFMYLGSIIEERVGSDEDMKARIGKKRDTFLQLMNLWNRKQMNSDWENCKGLIKTELGGES